MLVFEGGGEERGVGVGASFDGDVGVVFRERGFAVRAGDEGDVEVDFGLQEVLEDLGADVAGGADDGDVLDVGGHCCWGSGGDGRVVWSS